jgi:hypothetical protein
MWYFISQFYPPHRTTLPLAVMETGITVSQVTFYLDWALVRWGSVAIFGTRGGRNRLVAVLGS